LIKTKSLEPFLQKTVLVLYLDNKKLCKLKGKLLDITDSSITVESFFNIQVLSAEKIVKVKYLKPGFGRGENSEK